MDECSVSECKRYWYICRTKPRDIQLRSAGRHTDQRAVNLELWVFRGIDVQRSDGYRGLDLSDYRANFAGEETGGRRLVGALRIFKSRDFCVWFSQGTKGGEEEAAAVGRRSAGATKRRKKRE